MHYLLTLPFALIRVTLILAVFCVPVLGFWSLIFGDLHQRFILARGWLWGSILSLAAGRD